MMEITNNFSLRGHAIGGNKTKEKTHKKKRKKKRRGRELTIFKAEIAEKYGAPVYSRQPPITAIFPEKDKS